RPQGAVPGRPWQHGRALHPLHPQRAHPRAARRAAPLGRPGPHRNAGAARQSPQPRRGRHSGLPQAAPHPANAPGAHHPQRPAADRRRAPGRAESGDGQQLLTELAALSPVPVYVRAHNMLTTGDGTAALKWGSTNAYTEDKKGRPVYDWIIVDRIFDTYIQRGMKPI
nr:hypothetical protein [Tanacetum cinerariifolium]